MEEAQNGAEKAQNGAEKVQSCKKGCKKLQIWQIYSERVEFSHFPSEVARAQGQCLDVVLKMGVSAAFWGHPSPF